MFEILRMGISALQVLENLDVIGSDQTQHDLFVMVTETSDKNIQ